MLWKTHVCRFRSSSATIGGMDKLPPVYSWPALPEAIKAGILAMVTAAKAE